MRDTLRCYIESMSTKTKDAFEREVIEFLTKTGMAKTTFCREIGKSPSFVDRLQASNDVKASTIDQVRAYMQGKRAEIAARDNGA